MELPAIRILARDCSWPVLRVIELSQPAELVQTWGGWWAVLPDARDQRRFLLKVYPAAMTDVTEHAVLLFRGLGDRDWCVSVFKDNAGVVHFDDEFNVCFKVETHNRPSAIEPYGGANTGIGGVIRDTLGTGLGAKPICNTDIFCFAPPQVSHEDLPPGVLHPRGVAQGVVAGVRDYGNRMGIPTVNGAVFFDERYLGNPLVFCGNVAMLSRIARRWVMVGS